MDIHPGNRADPYNLDQDQAGSGSGAAECLRGFETQAYVHVNGGHVIRQYCSCQRFLSSSKLIQASLYGAKSSSRRSIICSKVYLMFLHPDFVRSLLLSMHGCGKLTRMKILTVDIGTGTQDIFLYNSNLDMENNFKLVVPSPTMIVHRQIKQATTQGRANPVDRCDHGRWTQHMGYRRLTYARD